jgi:hypothetical protein
MQLASLAQWQWMNKTDGRSFPISNNPKIILLAGNLQPFSSHPSVTREAGRLLQIRTSAAREAGQLSHLKNKLR